MGWNQWFISVSISATTTPSNAHPPTVGLSFPLSVGWATAWTTRYWWSRWLATSRTSWRGYQPTTQPSHPPLTYSLPYFRGWTTAMLSLPRPPSKSSTASPTPRTRLRVAAVCSLTANWMRFLFFVAKKLLLKFLVKNHININWFYLSLFQG
mgnify:CR=1 FL=1